MIVPDTNLLLHVYDSESPQNSLSIAWWKGCLAKTDPIGVCPVVLFGFLRISTNPRIFSNPLSVDEATEIVSRWLDDPAIQLLEIDHRDILKTLDLLRDVGTAANLTTDAQIAATALRYGAIIHTTDSDFGRFRGVRWINPLMSSNKRSNPS